MLSRTFCFSMFDNTKFMLMFGLCAPKLFPHTLSGGKLQSFYNNNNRKFAVPENLVGFA